MKDLDFGYFGAGDEGYAQYGTAFDRIFNTATSRDDASSDLSSDDAFPDDSDEDF